MLALIACTATCSIATSNAHAAFDKNKFWDMESLKNVPFDVQIVSTRTDAGYKVDEMYFTSEITPDGPNRIFCAFARPIDTSKPVGLLIDIHGGGGHCDPGRAMWFAQNGKCAVMNIDWSGEFIPGAKEYTKWHGPYANPYTNSYRVTPDPKRCSLYHIVIAARRAIDFATQQPGIDGSRVACAGGSWGGFLSNLIAGIDSRVKWISPALGAGDFKTSTYGRIGSDANDLPADQRKLWINIYDPASYSSKVTAKTWQYACSNDYYFWLGDVLDNYHKLNVDRQILIRPNSNHETGGPQMPLTILQWMDRSFNGTKPLPNIVPGSLKAKGNTYTWKTTGPAKFTRSILYWSPGNPVWTSRYWLPIEATQTNDIWHAEIPEDFAGLTAKVYVTAFDADDLAVSSDLVSRKGTDPASLPGPLWNNNAIWDISHGIDAWRPTGSCNNQAPAAHMEMVSGGISMGPQNQDIKFAALTNSLILASGLAQKSNGLDIIINGNKTPGSLTITLQKNSGAVNEIAYSATVKYSAGTTSVRLPWNSFSGPAGSQKLPCPFDGLRIDGERADKTPVIISQIKLY